MDITPTIPPDSQVIQSYGPGGFRISGQVYRHPVLVTQGRMLEWPVQDAASLSGGDFELIRREGLDVEVILLGCGATGMPVPSKLRAEVKALGFSLDAMDTGAACRTYNVMLSEGRKVAAALVLG